MKRMLATCACLGLSLLAAEERLAAGSHGVFSPDGRRIAFQAPGPDGLRVGVLTFGTRQVEWLTDAGSAAYPAWGPDGSVVYSFIDAPETAWAAAKNGSRNGCNLRGWKGGGVRQLTAGRWRDYAPSFSPDGTAIVYSSTEGEERLPGNGGQRGVNIRSVSATGGVSRTVLAFEPPQCAAVQPSFSSDGRLLAWAHVDGFRDNWAVAVARASEPAAFCRLTPPDMPAYAPRWLPDGRRLVCTACREGDPGWCVYLIDVMRGEMRRLAVGENPSVSPDGKTLLYDRDGHLLTVDFAAVFACAPVVALPQPEPVSPAAGLPEFSVAEARKSARYPLAMKPGDEPFHVSCEIMLAQLPRDFCVIVRGVYKESDRAFQVFVNGKGIPAFAMRRADGAYVGAHGGVPLKCGRRYRLVGVRAGDTLRLYVDGRLAGEKKVPQGILGPNSPVRLVVGENVQGEVARTAGGFGWPADIPRPPTPRELFGEDMP